MSRYSLCPSWGRLIWILLTSLSAPLAGPYLAAQTSINIDPSIRYQTVSGWECVTFASQDQPAFDNFKDELFARTIHEAGINRIRLEVRSGSENSTDFFAQYQNGETDYATWRANRYATVNDNNDPNVIEPSGFHFTALDDSIRKIVLPLRDLAARSGEPLYINLNYVAFTSQITNGGSYHHAAAAEYAEFVLAVFQHMDQEFGFVPDAVEILLEPDNVSQWNGTTLGNAIVAVAARLSAAGYHPEIIAPSCTNMGNAVTYFDALATVPGALVALDEICYHRYGGVSDANLQALASRGQQFGKKTSMLEWWSTGNSIDILLKDLTAGRNSAWQQGALAGVGTLDNSMSLYMVDVTNPSTPLVQANRKTRLLRQIYRFVRRGATRIHATSSVGTMQPLAFINADGGHVVVVRATASGAFTINGLPPGTYAVNYSNDTAFNVHQGDQTITSGQAITVSMPAAGAVTVYSATPSITAALMNGNVLEITVRSLKPGFSGSIEHIATFTDPAGWQEVGTMPSSDFTAKWSGSTGASSGFYRFRQ